MKKLVVLCIAALGAALLVLGTAPSASAYPEATCDVEVSAQTVAPGQSFTVTGTVKTAVDAQGTPVPDADLHWRFEWNGEVKTRTGRSVQATFTAPNVSKNRTITLSGELSSPAGDCVHHLDIAVVTSVVSPPKNHPHGGSSGLPGTGGPALWILVAGLALLLGGGGAVAVSRRRAS